MPKLNLDEQKSLFEPIEIILEGKNYSIEKITTKMMEGIDKLAKDEKAKDDPKVVANQLSIFLGAPASTFLDIDIRKLGMIVKFITEEISGSMEEKKTLPDAGK